MAYNKKEAQSKIQKLGELMTAKKYDEAWTSAGDLNAYLKANKDVMTGSDYEAINGILKNYYNINNQLEAVGKRAYGMGQKALNEGGVLYKEVLTSSRFDSLFLL